MTMSALTQNPLAHLNPASFGSAAIAQDEQLLRTSLPLRGERLSADGLGLLLKRVVDVVGTSLGLLFLAPVMLTISLLIRLDSPGPMLFRQVRRGHRGRPFRMLKFRTMVDGAERRLGALEECNESAGGVLFKLRHDPRVTRLGQVLRRSSLDEVPPFI